MRKLYRLFLTGLTLLSTPHAAALLLPSQQSERHSLITYRAPFLRLSPSLSSSTTINNIITLKASSSTTSNNENDVDYERSTLTSSSDTTIDTVRYRARVSYDGAGFAGFQWQPDKRTIQGELEDVLSTGTNQPVRVMGAGRTDTGVHARGQAIHFELREGTFKDDDEEEKLTSLEHSLNRMLRQDVRIWNIQRAPFVTKELNGQVVTMKWNAIYDTTGKLYVYRICSGRSMDPLERHTRLNLNWFPDVDIEILGRTLRCYEGTHDFRAFAGGLYQLEKQLGGKMDTTRKVYSVDLIDEGDGLYRIEVRLKGALYKMIRSMVGTALEVARGRLSHESFLALLNRSDSADRNTNKCKPAAPEGLTLERVFYPDFD